MNLIIYLILCHAKQESIMTVCSNKQMTHNLGKQVTGIEARELI